MLNYTAGEPSTNQRNVGTRTRLRTRFQSKNLILLCSLQIQTVSLL